MGEGALMEFGEHVKAGCVDIVVKQVFFTLVEDFMVSSHFVNGIRGQVHVDWGEVSGLGLVVWRSMTNTVEPLSAGLMMMVWHGF